MKNKNLRQSISEENISCVPMCDKLLEIYCADGKDDWANSREKYILKMFGGVSSVKDDRYLLTYVAVEDGCISTV